MNPRIDLSDKPNYLRPVQKELCLEQLATKEFQREQASSEILNLKTMLEQIQDEINTLENQMDAEREAYNKQLDHVLFNYLPSHRHNYSHTIGPIDWEIIENETRIGDFNLGESLNTYNMFGSVHVATNRYSKQQYSLKKLDKEQLVDLELLLMLEKEIGVHAQSHHPNITKFHLLIHAPRHIYVMTDLTYMDLNQYLLLHNDCISVDTLRELAIGVLHGLEYLHGHGVAHLDIKQENVFVSKIQLPIEEFDRAHVRICNFQSSEVHPRPGLPVPVYCRVGTPGFIAPEIITDLACADGRAADMWSVGTMLLWIVEGELSEAWMNAYNGDALKHENEILQCLVDLYERQQTSFNLELFDLICKLLVMIPSHRVTASQALAHPWFRLVGRQALEEVSHDWNRTHRHTI